MASCEVCWRTGGGIKRCTRCLSVWYCSPECQKQDWPMHKSSCDKTSRATQAASGDKAVPLAREDEKGSAGRQATSVGDPSASSVPSASGDPCSTDGLSASGESSTDSHCHKCGNREAELKKCSRCKKVTYCSRDCQRQDWATHKTACFTLSARVDDQGTAAENASSGENFVPRARELGATERQSTSSGDSSASGGSSTDLQCYKCGKRQAEMKKCAKCKKVTYCSRDCQRQHWASHKDACFILSTDLKTVIENGFGEMDSQVFEEVDRRMAIAFYQSHVSPLTLLMWTQAKPRAVGRYPGDEVIERFVRLESDMPWLSPSPRRVVLLCLIKDVHPFLHCAIVEDIDGYRRVAQFCIEMGPEPYFLYEQLREGNFLCLENALLHAFENGLFGFQIEDPSRVHIIEMI